MHPNLVGALNMSATNRRLILFLFIAVLLSVFTISTMSGCILRTRTGTEYKVLQPPDKPEKKQPEKQPDKDAKKSGDEFAELSRTEQEDLAMTAVEPSGAPEEKPSPEQKIAPVESSGVEYPVRITGSPKKEMPLIDRLSPVPATAETLLFDPETLHRSKRKAALDLTAQGVSALSLDKVELAISKFQKAISVDPKCGHAYFYFARARFIQKDWEQVAALADKSTLHLAQDSVFLSRAHLLKAQALANLKRYILALAACESAIEADSTNVQAKLLRSRIRNLY